MEAVADRKEVLVLITHRDIAKLEEGIKTKKQRREEGGQTMSEELGVMTKLPMVVCLSSKYRAEVPDKVTVPAMELAIYRFAAPFACKLPS